MTPAARVKAFDRGELGGTSGRASGFRRWDGLIRQPHATDEASSSSRSGSSVASPAGMLGKKIFELLWGLIDDQDPPEPKYRRVRLRQAGRSALVLEGAIFRLIRGFAEHGARHGFSAAVRRMARRRKSPAEASDIMSARRPDLTCHPLPRAPAARRRTISGADSATPSPACGAARSRAKGPRRRPTRSRIAGCAINSGRCRRSAALGRERPSGPERHHSRGLAVPHCRRWLI